jgi:hypothetical protein
MNQFKERMTSSLQAAEGTEALSAPSYSFRLTMQDAARSEMRRWRSKLGQLTGEQEKALETALASTIETIFQKVSLVWYSENPVPDYSVPQSALGERSY